MDNFVYHNPVRVVFGRGTIAQLSHLVPTQGPVLVTYGGGSIKRNGVHDQVKAALAGRPVLEFGGIEANPRYETLMRAVEVCRSEEVGFLLAVGGGSVLDGTKFIAAAVPCRFSDPWEMVAERAPVRNALPLGCVLTLPATGSEMNGYAVISRAASEEKRAFGGPKLHPRFSILDPETSFSLPAIQIANGVVDSYVHVLEQYLNAPAEAPLQDRQAEAILATLIEIGPKTLAAPRDYDARASLYWCATQALNGLIACGVPQDWSTHYIGHELTAFHGIDHAQSLAVVLPGVLRARKREKGPKLLQYGRRVLGITEGAEDARIEAAIDGTEAFFRSLGMRTRMVEYGIGPEAAGRIAERFAKRGTKLGPNADMGSDEVRRILEGLAGR